MRRRQPGDAPACRSERSERRQHEPQFSHAFAHSHDLGQRARRPATARQFAIEQREPGRQCPGCGSSGGTAAPDRLPAKDFLEGCH